MGGVFLSFLVVLAAGEEPDPMAVALFEEGAAAYEEARYGEALEKFEQAYELEPVPLLLLNIGQCHRKLGHPERAVEAFEGYLAAEPNAEDRAEVEELIASQRALLEPPEAADPKPPPPSVGSAQTNPPAIGTEVWIAAGATAGAVIVLAATAATIALVVVSQPEPVEPEGSLGTVVVP